jgi:hypothetical protein
MRFWRPLLAALAVAWLALAPVQAECFLSDAGFADKGGVLCTGSNQPTVNLNFLSGKLDPRITFTRASTATFYGSNGLLQTASSGVARFTYDPATLALLGLLIEESRTNSARWSRDLTNAAWTTLLGTTAKDQIGIDGVTNSASSFTATSGNATTLQTVVHVSSTDSYAVWIKRITGTGEIDLSLDGTTWTAATASNCFWGGTASAIVSAHYVRCMITQATVVNPAIGVRIVTNGDKVAVDQNQLEAGFAFPTSDIITTTAAVTRAADVATMTLASIGIPANPAGLTIIGKARTAAGNSARQIVAALSDGTNNNRMQISRETMSIQGLVASGGVNGVNISIYAVSPNNADISFWEAVAASDFAGQVVGQAKVTQSASVVTPIGLTTLGIGSGVAAVTPWNSAIARLQIYNRRLPDATAARIAGGM